MFYDAFSHISEHIDRVYKDLTKNETFPLGGTAYLSLEDTEEPYLEGIKYHAMPPMKRFRDMEQLSGGEKSVAALALLFAIHRYINTYDFVLKKIKHIFHVAISHHPSSSWMKWMRLLIMQMYPQLHLIYVSMQQTISNLSSFH